MGIVRRLSAAQIAGLACAMEVMCPKPGNVGPGRPFKYINEMSFLVSATGLAAAFEDEGASVGRMVEEAAIVTKNWVDRNTNLGMILLLAPLVNALSAEKLERDFVRKVLEDLGEDDSRRIGRAIRIASPEGLGASEKYDVRRETPPIMEAMKFASRWDSIAREYDTGYEITFCMTAPWLAGLWREGRALKSCVLQTYLMLLGEVSDTLISRKLGREASETVSREAREILRAGGCFTPEGRGKIAKLESSLAHPDNLLNPGTTADLTAAGIFVFLARELDRSDLSHIVARWEGDGCDGEQTGK